MRGKGVDNQFELIFSFLEMNNHLKKDMFEFRINCFINTVENAEIKLIAHNGGRVEKIKRHGNCNVTASLKRIFTSK